jgi:hypothetical protein
MSDQFACEHVRRVPLRQGPYTRCVDCGAVWDADGQLVPTEPPDETQRRLVPEADRLSKASVHGWQAAKTINVSGVRVKVRINGPLFDLRGDQRRAIFALIDAFRDLEAVATTTPEPHR